MALPVSCHPGYKVIGKEEEEEKEAFREDSDGFLVRV